MCAHSLEISVCRDSVCACVCVCVCVRVCVCVIFKIYICYRISGIAVRFCLCRSVLGYDFVVIPSGSGVFTV